ncbi:FxLYD domain-containing protein [Kroppenstedtia eburnea]|uniref:FxLYD domain-containing protein n=1 Tax=Kroppenstedtia eburnea TaxID=714067 RepID=UPI003641B725
MAVYRWSRAGLGLLMALSVIAAGCSTEGGSAGKDEKPVKSIRKEKDPQEHKIKNNTVSKVWKTSDGKVMAHGAAEIKNTGKKPVQLDSARLRFLGKDDRQLVEKEVLTIVPKVIQPGESAYVGATVHLRRAKSTGELKDMALDADYTPSYIPAVKMETESLSRDANDGGFTTVTGTVKNPNDQQVESILVTAALKNKQGNLIAVVTDYLDPGIPAGGQARFRAYDDKLPAAVTKPATDLEVSAYPVFEGEQK